jgi:hypothetical protein
MDHHPGPRILIFLPDAAAAVIAARLKDAGYGASVACTVPDLREALRATPYRLVVTTRPDIDTVRDIQPLPVVNLEIFFHPAPHDDSSGNRTKRFDAAAFFDRVKMLTEPARTRTEPPAPPSAEPAESRWQWPWRLLRPRPVPISQHMPG